MSMPALSLRIRIPNKPRITTEWEYVTPKLATDYLAANIAKNRNIRQLWLDTLVAVMEAGEFVPTHQGIAFDVDGNLVDGQHRLMSICKSGVSCWLLVSRGLDKSALLAMDLHAKRKPEDQIRMFDSGISPTSNDVAIARSMKSGIHGIGSGASLDNVLSDTAQIHAFLARHREAIRFCQRYGVKRTMMAPIRAAVAKAYYHVNHDKLDRWIEVFTSMLASDEREHAAVNLRKWMSDERNRPLLAGGQGARSMLCAMTLSSIHMFFRGLQGRSIKPVEDDPYPLPE